MLVEARKRKLSRALAAKQNPEGRGLADLEMGAGLKHLLTRLGVYTSSPVAFLVLILYAAL
jgi:hypothetical protein